MQSWSSVLLLLSTAIDDYTLKQTNGISSLNDRVIKMPYIYDAIQGCAFPIGLASRVICSVCLRLSSHVFGARWLLPATATA